MSTVWPGAQWLTSRAATLAGLALNGLASIDATALLLPSDSALAAASAALAAIANSSSRPEVGCVLAASSSTRMKRCASALSVRAWATPTSNPNDSKAATT
ncbi:hypothetical protein RLIN73S_05087 [Rhodanobacter lindaniclasticus]